MTTIERVSAFVGWLVDELDVALSGFPAVAVSEGMMVSGSQVAVGDVAVDAGPERAGTRRRPWVATVDVFAVGVVTGGSPGEAREELARVGAVVESVVNRTGVRTGGGVCDMSAVLISVQPFPSDNARGAVAAYAVAAEFRE